MRTVSTDQTAPALGPYSQAIALNDLVFTSGQIGLKPDGSVSGDTIEKQTHQVMVNLQHVLEAAGTNLSNVAKCTIFLKDMNDFTAMNEVYATYFSEHKPARECVEVSRLPKDLLIEISCIAAR